MQIVTLDLIPQKEKPIVKLSQYDNNRQVRFMLKENGETYTLAGTEIIEVNIRKPDRNIVVITPSIGANAYVDVLFTEQAAACFGDSFGELSIKSGDTVIGTCNFIIEVEISPTYGGIMSQSEIDNLNTQISGLVVATVNQIAPAIIEEIAPEIIGDEYPTKNQLNAALLELYNNVQNDIYRLIPKARLYTLLAGETVLNITLSPGLGVTDIVDFKINEPNIPMPDITYVKDIDLTDHFTLTFADALDHDVTIMLIETPYDILS